MVPTPRRSLPVEVGLHLAFRQPVHSALETASCSSIHREPRHVCVPSPVRVFVLPALPFINLGSLYELHVICEFISIIFL